MLLERTGNHRRVARKQAGANRSRDQGPCRRRKPLDVARREQGPVERLELADGVGDGEEPPGPRGHRAGPQRQVATRRLVTARMRRSVRHRRTSSCRLVGADAGGAARAPEGSRRVRRHGPADRPPGVAAVEPEPLSSGDPLVPDGDQVWFRFRADPGRLPGPPPPRRPGPSASAVAAACFRARLPGDPSPAAERTPRVVAGRRHGNESQAVALEHSRLDAVDRRVPLHG